MSVSLQGLVHRNVFFPAPAEHRATVGGSILDDRDMAISLLYQAVTSLDGFGMKLNAEVVGDVRFEVDDPCTVGPLNRLANRDDRIAGAYGLTMVTRDGALASISEAGLRRCPRTTDSICWTSQVPFGVHAHRAATLRTAKQ